MESEGLYIISVVSRLLRMHPQTLRKYERAGLVQPSRTDGMLRLYSNEDVRRLRLIKHLVEDLGLNLAGVEVVLRLQEGLERLRLLNQSDGAGARWYMDQLINELLAELEDEEL